MLTDPGGSNLGLGQTNPDLGVQKGFTRSVAAIQTRSEIWWLDKDIIRMQFLVNN